MQCFRAGSRLGVLLAVLIGCRLAAAGEEIAPKPVDGKIDWVYSYAAGQQQARQTGKAMLVVFRCER